MDNAFVNIGNFPKAQTIADGLPGDIIHKKIDSFARRYTLRSQASSICPITGACAGGIEHRDGNHFMKPAQIYSLPALQQLLLAANCRYLQFISAIEDTRPVPII